MSQLSPQAIDEFQELWKKHFDEALSQEEAAARAHQTFTVLRLILEPPPKPVPNEVSDPPKITR